MKFPITLLFLSLCLSVPHAYGQLFSEVETGAIVATPSDSRSINFVDVNQDGWIDIFVSNGLSGGQDNFLYINQGDGTFVADGSNPIAQDNSPSVGATFADWDNDGDLDAYVTNWYGDVNQWYENTGNGQFALSSLFSSLPSFSETASWGDFDQDGLVDLYVTNSDGNKKNFLFHNQGNGGFGQIDTGLWVNETELSRNVNWTDYDLDGDVDLFVSNENNRPNGLYQNDSTGVFSKIVSGPAFGSLRSSMSSSWGDIDNDGDLDLFVANAGFYQEQVNGLYLRDGNTYLAVGNDPVVTDGGCSYGSNFGDYDNDGDLDLIVSNGYCNSNLSNFLYENQGDGTFVRSDSELPNLPAVCSYGAAWGDINNDGFLDLMMANCKNGQAFTQPNNSLYLNNGNENNWLKISLEGVQSNRSAIGAIVRIKAQIGGESVWQLREVSAQSGYAGQNSLIVHVGLGDATEVDSLLIDWPSGIKNTQTAVAVNQLLEIQEDVSNSLEDRWDSGSIRCFPNPVEGICHIEIHLSSAQVGQQIALQLTDALGKRVWESVLPIVQPLVTTQLDLSKISIPSGLYWVQAKTESSHAGKQIVIR